MILPERSDGGCPQNHPDTFFRMAKVYRRRGRTATRRGGMSYGATPGIARAASREECRPGTHCMTRLRANLATPSGARVRDSLGGRETARVAAKTQRAPDSPR